MVDERKNTPRAKRLFQDPQSTDAGTKHVRYTAQTVCLFKHNFGFGAKTAWKLDG
jgi:hypothetical protein